MTLTLKLTPEALRRNLDTSSHNRSRLEKHGHSLEFGVPNSIVLSSGEGERQRKSLDLLVCSLRVLSIALVIN